MSLGSETGGEGEAPFALPHPASRAASTNRSHRVLLTEPRATAAYDAVQERYSRGMTPIAVVDEFAKAWAEHNLDQAISLVTEDCIFDDTAPAPDGALHVGKQALRRAWQPIFDDSNSSFEAEETFGADDRVVQLWRYTWRGGHVRGVDVFRVRDGLIAEKRSYVKG
jgi:SnoaL-like domain